MLEQRRSDRRTSRQATAGKRNAAEGSDAAASEANRQPLPPAAGPATRRLARKLEIDLQAVGAPDQGDVLLRKTWSRRTIMSATFPSQHGAGQPSLPDFEQFGPVDRQPLNKIARTATKHLGTSWRIIPQVTQHDLADITQLEAARRHYLESHGQSGPKITLTAIAIKAVSTLLKELPQFNASLDTEEEQLIFKRYYHIGVAVDTEEGLLVPTIRDADQKSIVELAAELMEVAQRARGRKLDLKDMEGATFTISNQGSIGGTAFTPLVSFPQVAILGMSRARPEVQMVNGEPQERLMLPLSLSYDHRVINGADAARFLARLTAELSDCFQLLVRT